MDGKEVRGFGGETSGKDRFESLDVGGSFVLRYSLKKKNARFSIEFSCLPNRNKW